MKRVGFGLIIVLVLSLAAFSGARAPGIAYATGAPFSFTTGATDGKMAMASLLPGGANVEHETGDDFILAQTTTLNSASFTGLIPNGDSPSAVVVEMYHVFPLDSANPPSGHVPTRVNSPSDVDFLDRDSTAAPPTLTYTTTVLNANFTALNSVLNGIHPIPNETTGGDGAVSGKEVQISVTFNPPIVLPAGHFFFVPQVGTASNNPFYWLSAPHTPPLFTGDLQTWIRNAPLEPDWLRVGTDIVGGATPPTFNASFSLAGKFLDAPKLFTGFCDQSTINCNQALVVSSGGGHFFVAFQVSNPNPSGGDLTGVAFADFLPAGVTVANAAITTCSAGSSIAPATAVGSGTIIVTGGTLLAGGSCNILIPVTVVNASNANSITNTTTGTSANESNPDVGAPASATLLFAPGNVLPLAPTYGNSYPQAPGQTTSNNNNNSGPTIGNNTAPGNTLH